MDVQLYVYDLSRGLARAMSIQFLGIQIDAIYHTSLVFGGVEYFFGGGVQTCYPGKTHHGAPMEVISMGRTSLPLDVILEYLESLKEIYTPESYDLFAHNCNNFTNDFGMFLVGKGIPNHITSLPETVLQTPFGQMLRPQIESAMRPVVQAPAPPQSVGQSGSARNGTIPTSNGVPKHGMTKQFEVRNVTTQQKLDELLEEAKSSCAVIFFTSATCPPCKTVYPLYDELAAEAQSKATLIKVDISNAHALAAKFSIRATPTFISFLKGKQEDKWAGADPTQLRGNVRMLIQAAFPPHLHANLKLPTLLRMSRQPVTYAKIPPLEKLVAKMGEPCRTPIVSETVNFISARSRSGAQEARVPDLTQLAMFLQKSISVLPPEILFTVYDLFRLTLVDARVSGFFSEERNHQTIVILIEHVNNMASCPYNLRLVAIHTACNLFTTPLFADSALSDPALASAIVTVATNNLLEPSSSNLRPAAAALAFNLANAEHLLRTSDDANDKTCLSQPLQAELAASLIEALSPESKGDSPEVVRGLAVALARLVYKAPQDGEVVDLCRALEAGVVVMQKEKEVKGEDKGLLKEIGEVLLGRGIRV